MDAYDVLETSETNNRITRFPSLQERNIKFSKLKTWNLKFYFGKRKIYIYHWNAYSYLVYEMQMDRRTCTVCAHSASDP